MKAWNLYLKKYSHILRQISSTNALLEFFDMTNESFRALVEISRTKRTREVGRAIATVRNVVSIIRREENLAERAVALELVEPRNKWNDARVWNRRLLHPTSEPATLKFRSASGEWKLLNRMFKIKIQKSTRKSRFVVPVKYQISCPVYNR